MIVNLSAIDFVNNKKIKYKKEGIIMFGVSWCGFCKKALPSYIRASELIGKYKSFYYVNCEKVKVDINGYPSFYLVDKNGNIYKKYDGGRTVKDFVNAV
jgi:thiol-disulfide isomerase/thioredoxin